MSYTVDTVQGNFVIDGTETLNLSEEGNQSNFDTVQVKVDNSAPSISNLNLNDGERVNSDFGPIQFDVNDQMSSVESVSIEILEGDNSVYTNDLDCSDNSCSENFPEGELNHGNEYDLEIYREDSRGNSDTDSYSFTYDNQYEGDSSPTVSPEPQVFRMEMGADSFLFNVELEGKSEPSQISVTCEYQDGIIAGTAFDNVPDDGIEDYTCDLDPMEFINQRVDVSLKMEDEAGNSASESVGTYYFDFTPPEFGNLSTVVGVFNSDFDVSYDAKDAGEELEVAKIHYQLDNSVLDLEEGVNVSEVDGDFRVNTEGLSAGENTVYAWAVDRAGRVSEVSSLEFDFMPSATPKASISVDQEMSVVAGESKTIRSNISNTGQLLIGEMDVQLSSDIANRSRTIRELKPGEKTDAIFNIDTEPSYLGAHTVELSTKSPDTSKTIRFIVEANKEQEQRIESNYNEYIEKYNALKENVTGLKDSGLSSSREERLDSNTSDFFSDMEAARRAKQSGDLYEVENHLENISDDYSAASTSYSEIKKEHEAAEWNQTVALLLLVFVALGGSGLAYVTYFSDQYVLDKEALMEEYEFLEGPVETVQTTLDQYEITLEPLENAVEYVGELLAEEEEEIEEAEQQAFQGFT